MSKTEISFTMRECCENMDNTPSEEESYKNISGVMNPCYDTCQTGDKSENKKEKSDARFLEEYMERPPRSSPEHCVSRRKRIVWKVIDKRRETRYTLWSWTDWEKMIDNPIDRKCTHNVPKEIESDMFRSIIFHRQSVEPETYQKQSEEDRFQIRKKENGSLEPD